MDSTNNPFVIWSLFDLVEKYHVGELVDLQSFVAAWNNLIKINDGIDRFNLEQMVLVKGKIQKYIDLLELLDLPVSRKAAKQALSCLNAVEEKNGNFDLSGQNRDDLSGSLGTLANIVGTEMSVKLFFVVPANKIQFFEQETPLFGDDVSNAFPNAVEDVSEAGKCFACGRNTAAVFHLMRAMEVAVQVIAGELGASVQDANGKGLPWGVIASNMKPKIDDLPRGSAEQIQWYKVHSYLESINRAWRAPTAHPKQTYTEEETLNVINAVKGFIQELATLA